MPTLPLHMRLRKVLLNEILAHAGHPGLSSAALGKRLGITRARATDLRAGRVELFSLDALADLAGRAGLKVTIDATRPYRT